MSTTCVSTGNEADLSSSRRSHEERGVAQYAVNGIHKPIGIAEFDLFRDLSVPLAENLPSIEQIEAKFANEIEPL